MSDDFARASLFFDDFCAAFATFDGAQVGALFAVIADIDEGLSDAQVQRVLGLLADHGIGVVELGEKSLDRHGIDSAIVEISDDGAWKHISQNAGP